MAQLTPSADASIATFKDSPMETALRKHAVHYTYFAALAGLVVLIASFWFSLHWAWFLRGVILGMFVMVAVAWAKAR
jgi:hypothetical protein